MIKDARTLTLAVRPCFCIAYVIGRLIKIKMKRFNTLPEIIEQLEKPNYQTEDGLHNLVNNAAFVQLKELGLPNMNEVIEDLKSMSNNYLVCNQSYVIPKSVLDMYIEHLEGRQNAL